MRKRKAQQKCKFASHTLARLLSLVSHTNSPVCSTYWTANEWKKKFYDKTQQREVGKKREREREWKRKEGEINKFLCEEKLSGKFIFK